MHAAAQKQLKRKLRRQKRKERARAAVAGTSAPTTAASTSGAASTPSAPMASVAVLLKRKRRDETSGQEGTQLASGSALQQPKQASPKKRPKKSPLPSPAVSKAAPEQPLPAFVAPPFDLHYDANAVEQQLKLLASEPVLGIDIEWRPTFVSGQAPHRTALVQLSSCTRCVLVPVRYLSRLPPSLATIMADPRIWKVGCGIVEDARKLQRDLGIECAPVLEIGQVATRLQRSEGLAFPALADEEAVRPGLRGLALACGYELSKPKSISRSNWERRPLTPQQQRYAALDAYAGVWIAGCLQVLHANQTGRVLVARKWMEEQAARLAASNCKAQP